MSRVAGADDVISGLLSNDGKCRLHWVEDTSGRVESGDLHSGLLCSDDDIEFQWLKRMCLGMFPRDDLKSSY